MKDPNLSELVRTCIRCWLYLVPQAFLGIHLFDMFMRRKNSIKPLMIWQLLRVFLIGGISDIILRGYYGDESWWGILMMFCSVVIMIANTVLIYYTFEGSLPKVLPGISGYRADALTKDPQYRLPDNESWTLRYRPASRPAQPWEGYLQRCSK